MTRRNFVRRFAFLFFCATLLLGTCFSVAEQPAAAPSKQAQTQTEHFVFHKNVHQVIVDVTVRDSAGKPVHGLAAKDFTLLEDGHPQRLLSFEAHDLDTPSISLPPNTVLPPNVFVNVPKTPERGPLYVIFYDMLNMESDDQIYARQQILQFVRTKPEGTRFSLYVHSDGLHLVQGFTDDKDLIYAALDPENPKAHVPRSFLFSRNFGKGDPVAVMSALTHVSEFLDGIPGRKNLIWLGSQFPLAFFPREGDPTDLQDDERHLTNELTRAQVAVYPINVRGVVANPEGALTGGGPHTGVGGVEAGTVPGAPSPSALNDPAAGGALTASQTEGHASSLTRDHGEADAIATATGGRAFYSDNGIKQMLDAAVEDGANYYTLSYSPSNSNYDGSLRKISIVLAKHGFTMSYRRSYFADDPDVPRHTKKSGPLEDDQEAEVKREERPMYASLQHGAPLTHQLIFKVRIHPLGMPTLATSEEMAKLSAQPAFARGKANPKLLKPIQIQNYAIYYLLAANQIRSAESGPLPLEFAAVAFNSDGKILNGVFERVVDGNRSDTLDFGETGATSSGQIATEKVHRAMQELEVPVTATSLRIAVRDTLTDRIGSLEIPLPLPPEPAATATGGSAPIHVN